MDKDVLEQRLAAGESYEAIARSLGRDASTISQWARRRGLTSVHVGEHSARGGIGRDVLAELVGEGLSTREIAVRVDRSYATVRYWLRQYGLKTRRTVMSELRTTDQRVALLHCRRHGETRFIRRGDNNAWRCARCRMEAVMRRRKRVKEVLVREAGGRCWLCGYDRHVGALVFHHLDPAEKSSGINRLGASLGRARAEAQKCVLLCANCHAEVESGTTRLPFDPAPRVVSGVAQ